MQFSRPVLITTFLLLLYSVPSNSSDNQQLVNWIKFCPSSQLCFQRPESLMPSNVLAIDSITGQLNNKNITLTYDLGWYASKFSELTSATSEPIVIDGHHGKLLLQGNKMALSVPKVTGKIAFSMLIEFKNTKELEQGRKIFKSVKFNL